MTMDKKMGVIGIDIGGTKISAALFLANGHILKREISPVPEKGGKEVVRLIGDLVLSLIRHAEDSDYKVVAVGACVPGIYDPVEKTAWAPNIPDWEHIPLWEMLKAHLQDPSIELVIESDRSCYILGEIWKGCAQGCTDAIFIAVGTGIGAGILCNGQIIGGRNGIAGAVGWMALEPPYLEKYDGWGNFEHYASGDGIARSAVEMLGEAREQKSILDSIPVTEITAYHVFEALEANDPLAMAVMDKAIGYWGMAVANLVSTFNPQKVIFGGGIFGPAVQFLDRIGQQAELWAQPLAMRLVTLEASVLGGDAGLIGTGCLAIRTVKNGAHGS
ncbi:MAG: ROK family protein [Bacteroidota bacterium]